MPAAFVGAKGKRPLAGRSAALRVVSGHLTGASLRALRQDPAEVAVLRPELDARGVIGPGLAALRAGAGQLPIHRIQRSRPSGRSATPLRLIQAWPFCLAGSLEAPCRDIQSSPHKPPACGNAA